MATRTVGDTLDIMRRAIGRRNVNDPESSAIVLMKYINDFYSLTMSDDLRLFENFGTLAFTIDETNTTGVYNLDDLEAQGGQNFVSLSLECYISLLDPVNNSVSWNYLSIYQNAGEFFTIWGINNTEILIPGYPTNLLFYGNELTFRTIPNTSYLVNIYGYKMNADFAPTPDGEPPVSDVLPFARWMRFIAYGAALNYAMDFRFAPDAVAHIKAGFAHERKLMLTHAHNQQKLSRAMPRF